MELLPVTADYDTISTKMRQFAATRLMEIIEAMRPHVQEVLSEPVLDLEPGRIQANVAMVKAHMSLIKELGLLYRVQDRPHEEREDMLPLRKVQELLAEQEARFVLELELREAAALQRGRQEAAEAKVLSLGAARERVQRGLGALRQQ